MSVENWIEVVLLVKKKSKRNFFPPSFVGLTTDIKFYRLVTKEEFKRINQRGNTLLGLRYLWTDCQNFKFDIEENFAAKIETL